MCLWHPTGVPDLHAFCSEAGAKMKLDVELHKQFKGFDLDVAFTLEGGRTGIFGPSGSGKSTLGGLLAGLQLPDGGSIRLNDRQLYDHARRVDLRPERRRIAVVFQQAHLFPHLDVRRNLLYGYRRLDAVARKLKLDEVVAALEIEHLLGREPARLSGGEKQRVALGRALLASPELLILDEPLSALDHQLKDQIIPYLRKTLRRFSIPYLYISHSLREMRLLTDRVLQVQGGRIVSMSDAESLAKARMSDGRYGYMNHLHLEAPREVGSMLGYRWGENELLVSDHVAPRPGLFELSSKDVLLFRQHPQAISARNLLRGTITALIPQGGSVAVELDCNGEKLVAQVVREAVVELALEAGRPVYAAIKASAFRRLV